MKEPLKLKPKEPVQKPPCEVYWCTNPRVGTKYCEFHSNKDRHLIKSSYQRRKNDKKNLGL